MYYDATAVMVVVLVQAGPDNVIPAHSRVFDEKVFGRGSRCDAATGERVVGEVVGEVSESGSGNRAG